jgi:hypothetical protein
LEPGADLGLLQSHRMSHVAETGQLGSRARHVGNTSNGRTSPINVEPLIPEPEPRIEVTLHAESQVDLHFENPRAAPSAPVPRGLFETPMPAYLDSMSDCSSELDLGVVQDVERTKFLDEPRPRCPSPGSKKERSFHAERDSKILRKVNSSFQVLQPGSFAPPKPAQIEPAHSVNGRKPDHPRRHSRRLHRKQGSGSSSRRTSFIEIIYGNERHPS